MLQNGGSITWRGGVIGIANDVNSKGEDTEDEDED